MSSKIALITGANKGIGLETARQLGKQGITVLLGARDAGRGSEALAVLQAEGIQAKAITLDVTNAASLAQAAQQVEAEYGKLDILVNNAGVGGFDKATSEETPEDWRRVFETNVFGLIATTQAFLPLLRKSDAGRIVNLSSILGSLTMATTQGSPVFEMVGLYSAYGASKAAVNMYTVQLAHELADTNIKVNAAHPGWVKTDMGGENAPMDIPSGAKTSVALATLPEDGQTGAFVHAGKPLPW